MRPPHGTDSLSNIHHRIIRSRRICIQECPCLELRTGGLMPSRDCYSRIDSEAIRCRPRSPGVRSTGILRSHAPPIGTAVRQRCCLIMNILSAGKRRFICGLIEIVEELRVDGRVFIDDRRGKRCTGIYLDLIIKIVCFGISRDKVEVRSSGTDLLIIKRYRLKCGLIRL